MPPARDPRTAAAWTRCGNGPQAAGPGRRGHLNWPVPARGTIAGSRSTLPTAAPALMGTVDVGAGSTLNPTSTRATQVPSWNRRRKRQATSNAEVPSAGWMRRFTREGSRSALVASAKQASSVQAGVRLLLALDDAAETPDEVPGDAQPGRPPARAREIPARDVEEPAGVRDGKLDDDEHERGTPLGSRAAAAHQNLTVPKTVSDRAVSRMPQSRPANDFRGRRPGCPGTRTCTDLVRPPWRPRRPSALSLGTGAGPRLRPTCRQPPARAGSGRATRVLPLLSAERDGELQQHHQGSGHDERRRDGVAGATEPMRPTSPARSRRRRTTAPARTSRR